MDRPPPPFGEVIYNTQPSSLVDKLDVLFLHNCLIMYVSSNLKKED